jgi:hypothetical protein
MDPLGRVLLVCWTVRIVLILNIGQVFVTQSLNRDTTFTKLRKFLFGPGMLSGGGLLQPPRLHELVESLEPDLMEHLSEHRFEGNVRELENAVQRMLSNKGEGKPFTRADWLEQQIAPGAAPATAMAWTMPSSCCG